MLVEDIHLSAYISSCSKATDIVGRLLSNIHSAPFVTSMSEAVADWKAIDSRIMEPEPSIRSLQKNWNSTR